MDDWMKRYINKHRMKFIENLTDLFIQGFPGLHNSYRNKITCRLRQDGYIIAHGELLDCIMRIDNFPTLFIKFCEKNDCTPELARIMQEGIMKYEYNEASRRRRGILPSIPQAGENNQGSTDCGAAVASFHSPDENNESDQRVTSNHYTASSVNSNVLNEDTNEINVAFDDIDQKKGTTSSEGSAEMLLRQLKSITNYEKRKETDENGDTANDTERECATNDMVCMNVDNKRSLSNAAQQITQCPCPHHANVSGEKTSLPYNNERQMSNSVSDIENVQTNNNMADRQYNNELAANTTILFCDPNNMNTNGPIKQTYRTKMTVTKGNIAVGGPNITNVTNDKPNEKNKRENALSSAGKCDNLDKNKDDASDNKGRQSLQNPESEEKGQHTSSASQGEADSSGSYYLTSSDEEDLLCNMRDTCETEYAIENLKLPALKLVCSKEEVQNSDKVMTDFRHNTRLKEIVRFEPSKTSEMTSGIQCQEDIERNKHKNEIIISEKKQSAMLINQSKRNTYIESSITKDLANDDSLDFKMKNININDKTNEPIQEFVESCSAPAVINHDERTESIMSDTQIEKVDGLRINKALKQNIMGQATLTENQCKFDSCGHLSNSHLKKNTEINGNSINIEDAVTSPLKRNDVSQNLSTESEGFEACSNLSGADYINFSAPYSSNLNESSSGFGVVSLVPSASSETRSLEISIHSTASDKLNVEDREKLDREKNSETRLQTSTLNKIREDNSVLTSNPNIASDHIDLPEPHHGRTNNDNIECVHNCSPIPLQETPPNIRSYLFDNIYTPMRNIVQNFFPEFRVWF